MKRNKSEVQYRPLKSRMESQVADPRCEVKALYAMWMEHLHTYPSVAACPEYTDSVYVLHTDHYLLFFDRASGNAYLTVRTDPAVPLILYNIEEDADGKYRASARLKDGSCANTMSVCATRTEAQREMLSCALDMAIEMEWIR